MWVRTAVAAAIISVAVSACSAVEDEVVNHLETLQVRDLEEERGQTRFRNLGATTLKLVCRRTGELEGVCYTVPLAGSYTSCQAYNIQRKSSPDFSSLFMGNLSVVSSAGAVPAAEGPR